MLAERRDLTVATYSSVRGRGDRLMVWVLTGRGGGAWPCFASVLPHPVETSARDVTKVTRSMTASLFIRAFLKTPRRLEMRTASAPIHEEHRAVVSEDC